MTVCYHLWLDEAAKGPFTLGQLRAMWNSGQLTTESLFSTNSGEEWHYLADLIGQLEPQPVLVASEPQIIPRVVEVDDTNYKKRLAEFINKGWTILSEGPTGAQLQGPKEMVAATKVCLALGVILLLAYGSGLILIICALIGHANQKPKTEFIPRDNSGLIKSQNASSRTIEKFNEDSRKGMSSLLVIIIVIGLVIFIIYAKSSADKNFQDTVSQLQYSGNK